MSVASPVFPEIIDNLPKAAVPLDGVEARLLQGKDQQVLFMRFEKDAEIPEHSHEELWTVVLEGRSEMTIGGQKRTFRKGDTFFIPKGVKHSARIQKGYADVTFFNQRDRYRAVK